MSLPQEHINAQRRIWSWFAHGVLPGRMWPRHLLSGVELQAIYDDAQRWRDHQAAEARTKQAMHDLATKP